jgi:hypothetical protein
MIYMVNTLEVIRRMLSRANKRICGSRPWWPGFANGTERYNQGASYTKGKARKRKEMKATLLSFVFNNFLESGLFNALRLIQIKKSLPSKFASQVVRNACPEDMPIRPAGAKR